MSGESTYSGVVNRRSDEGEAGIGQATQLLGGDSVIEERILEPGKGIRRTMNGKSRILFTSSDYLGLAGSDVLRDAAASAVEAFGCSSSTGPAGTGLTTFHKGLSGVLSGILRKDSSALFSSGFQANISLLPAIAGDKDVVVGDQYNHPSLRVGAKLSGAKILTYKHCDVNDLERLLSEVRHVEGRIVIASVGLFPSTSLFAPLPEIVAIAKKAGAMVVVDDGHGFGVFGNTGAGCAEAMGVLDDVHFVTASLSKAIGSEGGFAAGPESLISAIGKSAIAYRASSVVSPLSVGISLASVRAMTAMADARKGLMEKAAFFRKELKSLGYSILGANTPIVPVFVGDAQTTVDLTNYLFDNGVVVQPYFPPFVAEGTERLRLIVTAMHDEGALSDALSVFRKAMALFGNRLGKPNPVV